MTVHWEARPELDGIIKEAADSGSTAGQIAANLSTLLGQPVTPNQVSGRLTRIRLMERATVAAVAPRPDAPAAARYPAAYATPNFSEMIERPVLHNKQSFDSVIDDAEKQTILRVAFLSDTHGTAVDMPAFEWALDVIREHGADIGIHGGDLFDFTNLSDNHAPTRHVSFEDELDGGALTLRAMEDTNFPWLAVVANHDVRIEKRVANRLDTYLLPWVTNPIDAMVNRSPYIYTPDRPNMQAWWLRLGDIIAAHVEQAPGVQSAAGKGYSTFTSRADDFGFDSSPIRGVFAGHPHKFRMEFIGRRTALVDLDCLQRTPEYVLTGPGVKYIRGATQGVTFATLRKGRLDLDSIEHRVFLGG